MSEKTVYSTDGRARDGADHGLSSSWPRHAIAFLFLGLAALQYADLHSTVIASAHQAEANRLILSLTHWMSPISAVFFVKAIVFMTLFLLRKVWGRGGHDDKQWCAFLALAFVGSLAVVANNYLAR